MSEKKSKPNVHAGHRQRMLQRFLECGLDNYQKHEVLEQFLFEFIPRINTNPIGHELIFRFETVHETLLALRTDLIEVEGIGKTSAENIAAAKARMSEYILRKVRELDKFTEFEALFCADWFMWVTEVPVVAIALLDSEDRLLDFIAAECHEDEEFDPAELGKIISCRSGVRSYYMIYNQDSHTCRGYLEQLRHHTMLHKVRMLDALYFDDKSFYSLIYRRAFG